MNDRFATILTKWADSMESRLGNAENFALTEVPLYVQEYLAWEFWSNAATAGVLLTITAVSLCVIRNGIATIKKTEVKEDDGAKAFGVIVAGIICAIVFIAGTTCFFTSLNYISQAAKIKLAPRVVIVEHIKTLAGEKK